MDAGVVVGAGGIGCVVGYALLAVGHDVTFVDANPRKVTAGNATGVRVAGFPARAAKFVPFDEWEPTPGRPVWLCTKCYDNAAVLAKLPADTDLIPVQNGFDAALDARPHGFEGIASFVSRGEKHEPKATITRRGDLHVGPRRAREVSGFDPVTALQAARSGLFRLVSVERIEPFKYAKLMYNAAISPLAAAAGLDNGKLLSDPAARRLFFALIRENYAILSGAGIELGKVGPFRPATVAAILRRGWLARLMAFAFEPSLRGTYCSMAGEIETGRTEIDNYTGHLLKLAGDRTPCPLNKAVYELVTRMTREKQPPSIAAMRELPQ